MTNINATNRYQSGQSTVEFVVLSLVMVPLLLIVPLLGKYMDIAQTTAAASRYTAFEGTVRHSSSTDGWKSDADLATEVRRRFFSNSDAPIKTNDAAGDFTAHRNTLWFDHRGDPLLPQFVKNVGVVTQKDSMSQPLGALAGSFNLPQENLYTGRVNVNIADIKNLKPFDLIGLTTTRWTTVLVDPWAASGPDQVTDKVQNAGLLFPYKPLELIAKPLGLLMSNPVLAILGTDSSPPEVGRVDPNRVPSDRVLKPYQ